MRASLSGMTATAEPEGPARIKGSCAPMPTDRLQGAEAIRVSTVFKALADPTRIEMVHFLKAAPGPICVCDFTEVFGLSQPTVSHHLARLREAGIVACSKRGVWAFYQLCPDMSSEAAAAVAAIP